MFTLFDALQLAAIVGGLALGIAIGGGHFGTAGAVVGGVAGVVAGWAVGETPWLLAWAWMRRDLRRATPDELRRRVGEEWYIAHLLIAELASRGETIDDLRPVIQDQLRSGSPDTRRAAEHTAGLWFPDLIDGG